MYSVSNLLALFCISHHAIKDIKENEVKQEHEFVTLKSLQEMQDFTAQSTRRGHVERGQFALPNIYWAGLVLLAGNHYCAHSFARN